MRVRAHLPPPAPAARAAAPAVVSRRPAPPVRVREVLGAPRAAASPAVVRRQPDPRSDPARFERLHESLFVTTATPSGTPPVPWVAGTETTIVRQFKESIEREMEASPSAFVGTVDRQTTERQAEADALAGEARLQATYSLPTRLAETAIRQAVVVFAPDFEPADAPSADFLENWVDNQLPRRTDVETFDLQPTDPRYRAIVTGLAGDSGTAPFAPLERGIRRQLAALRPPPTPDEIDGYVEAYRRQVGGKSWSWLFNRKASRTGAFEGQGRVFLSEGLPEARRRAALVHELVHLHAHADYERWLAATTSPRLFGEGFTEHLARQAMSAAELSGRRSYDDSLAILQARVLPFVSLDDVARAYFRAEVWRLEAKSAVARELFESQVGLAADAPRSEEVSRSAGAAGFVQVVEPGSHFRFLGLAVAGADPKPEHEAFLRQTIVPLAAADPALRLRFVGHGSSTGPAWFNQRLSERRAAAFLRAAQAAGVPAAQLLDAAAPAGRGETEPTAGNADVHGRAFNRRVELFVTRQETAP